MPIIVPCPKCGTKLSAPDAAAGKQIRCPKVGCGTITTLPALIPAEEVAVVEAALAAPLPSSTDEDNTADNSRKKRKLEADEDDRKEGNRSRRDRRGDDDDEKRPKRKRRRDYDDDKYTQKWRPKQKTGMGVGMIVAVIFGGLIMVGGVGYGLYALVGKASSVKDDLFSSVPKSPPPPGWKQYTFADDHFRAYMPLEPHIFRGIRPDKKMPWEEDSDDFSNEITSGNLYLCGEKKTSIVSVKVFQLRSGARYRKRWDANIPKDGPLPLDLGEIRTIKWFGEKGYQLTTRLEAARFVLTDVGLFGVAISSSTGTRTTPEEESSFFDNFELLK